MQDLFAAIAIALILEGMMPFANPEGWRRMVARVAGLPDKQLRVIGLVVMLVGLALLQLVRN